MYARSEWTGHVGRDLLRHRLGRGADPYGHLEVFDHATTAVHLSVRLGWRAVGGRRFFASVVILLTLHPNGELTQVRSRILYRETQYQCAGSIGVVGGSIPNLVKAVRTIQGNGGVVVASYFEEDLGHADAQQADKALVQ